MKEVLLSLHQEYWDLIKSGEKTMEIRKTKPQNVIHPFRVIVYVTGGIGVVGKFDCDETISTIRPALLVDGSCLTEEELIKYAAGKSLCGWHVKENSVVEYESPIPLEIATGLKRPPQSWMYLEGGENDKEGSKREIAAIHS